MSTGAITRKQIIEDDALTFGEVYAQNLDKAIAKNKEFIQAVIALNEANKAIKSSNNEKEFFDNVNKSNEAGKKALEIWKEQNKLELQLISTKKQNLLATEGTNRALVKERILLSDVNKEVKQQVREQLGMVTAYEKLNKARTDAQKRLGDLLSAEKQNIAQIVIAQTEFNKLDARVKAVDSAIKNYSKNIGNYQSAFQGLSGTMKDLVSAFGVVTGIALFGTIVKDIFSVIKDFDRQLIAVGKTTNMSGAELKQFGKEVVELGQTLNGVTVDGLIQSAEVAGQLGVTGTANILKFSRAIEELKLTSNIISEEQVGQFAKFIEVSSDSFDNADRLASVITQLGNSFATTEAEVLANSTEIQKGIAVWNTSAQSVLALGSATSTLGSEAEASRSAIQTTFQVIDKAISTGTNLQQVLKLTGLTQAELSKQFNKDAGGVFVKFVKGLSDAKNQGENLNNILSQVDITEKRAFTVIGSLASNYDILKSSLEQANLEYENNTALGKEVAAASESISSIIGDLRDNWEAYVLQTNEANNGTGALTTTLKFLRDNFKEIIDFVLKAGAVLFTYLGVMKSYNFVVSAGTALQTALTAAQIRFALSTGIGTKAILEQAAAARAATVAQEGLNIATKATPWGMVIGLVSAAVVAYMAFNEQLSENQKIQKKVNDTLADQKTAAEESMKAQEKFLASQIKSVEDSYAVKKARQGDSKKLDKEEIEAKKKVVQNEIETNNMQIQANLTLLNELKKASSEKIKILEAEAAKAKEWADRTSDVGADILVERTTKALTDYKTQSLISQNALAVDTNKFIELNKKAKAIISDLDKDSKVKDASDQAEMDKKRLAALKKAAKERYDLERKLADDDFKLRQFRLQVAIDAEKDILDNEKANFEDRLDALLEFEQLSQAKAKESAEYELQQLGKYNEDKMRFERELSDAQITEIINTGKTTKKLTDGQQLIYEKYQNSLTEIAKKGAIDRQKLIDNVAQQKVNESESKVQGIDTKLNDRITEENKLYENSLKVAGKNFELIEQATKAHERRLLAITQDYSKQKLQVQIDAMQKILDDNAKLAIADQISVKEREGYENKLSQYRKELSQLNVDTVISANENIVLSEKEKQERITQILTDNNERIRQLTENLASSLIDLANTVFDARIANIDNEIQASNDYYDQQIELAGNDANKKKLLEEEKAKKQKELEKERKKEMVKAAIFNKVISLAEIGINLAKTLTAINLAARMLDTISFGTAGLPYQGLQTALAIGIASAQAATVLATPLPKYKHGRKGGPAELAITGDGYVPEVISNPDGSNPIITPSVPTLTFLDENKMVHSSVEQYKKFMINSINEKKNKNAKTALSAQMAWGGISYDFGKMETSIQKGISKGFKSARTNVNIDNNIGYEIWRIGNIKWHK